MVFLLKSAFFSSRPTNQHIKRGRAGGGRGFTDGYCHELTTSLREDGLPNGGSNPTRGAPDRFADWCPIKHARLSIQHDPCTVSQGPWVISLIP